MVQVMSNQRAQATFTVLNDKGMHARPCSELVKLAAKFTSRIWIEVGSRRVDAKSLLGLLTLAAEYGSEINVIAEGEDSEQAVKSIQKLAQKKFYQSY